MYHINCTYTGCGSVTLVKRLLNTEWTEKQEQEQDACGRRWPSDLRMLSMSQNFSYLLFVT